MLRDDLASDMEEPEDDVDRIFSEHAAKRLEMCDGECVDHFAWKVAAGGGGGGVDSEAQGVQLRLFRRQRQRCLARGQGHVRPLRVADASFFLLAVV